MCAFGRCAVFCFGLFPSAEKKKKKKKKKEEEEVIVFFVVCVFIVLFSFVSFALSETGSFR